MRALSVNRFKSANFVRKCHPLVSTLSRVNCCNRFISNRLWTVLTRKGGMRPQCARTRKRNDHLLRITPILWCVFPLLLRHSEVSKMVHFGGGEAGGGVGGPWSSIQNKKVSTHVLILSFVHVIHSLIHSFVMQSELFQKTRTQR